MTCTGSVPLTVAFLAALVALLAALVAVPRSPPSDPRTHAFHPIADYKLAPHGWWHEQETASTCGLTGRVAIVTGASSGIGKAVALELYRRGATVIATSRSRARATAAARDIEASTDACDAGTMEPMALNLAELSDVRRFVSEFSARHTTLTYLVENAGAIVVTANLTSDGFEQNYAGNFLGHFLLLNLILPALKASATPARITATSSIAHWVHTAPLGSLLPRTSAESGGMAHTPLPLGALMEQYGNTKVRDLVMTVTMSCTSSSVPRGS